MGLCSHFNKWEVAGVTSEAEVVLGLHTHGLGGCPHPETSSLGVEGLGAGSGNLPSLLAHRTSRLFLNRPLLHF